MWHAFERLETVKSCMTASRFVRNHSSHASPKNLRWSAWVLGAPPRVRVHGFALEFRILQLVAVQRARDVDVFSTDDHYVLTVEDLLRDGRCKSPQEVAATVNHDRFSECR